MTIWVLQREDGGPGWDEAGGMVVRAATADEARRIAARSCRDEGPEVWLRPHASTCEAVPEEGPAEAVLVDYRGA